MKDQSLQINTQELHYKYYGSQDSKWDILILHWWWGKSDSWMNVAEILSKNLYNVYIPDLPGFWKTTLSKVYTIESYAQLIEEFVQKLWITPKLLLWHSKFKKKSKKNNP